MACRLLPSPLYYLLFLWPPNESQNYYSLNRLNFTEFIIIKGHTVAQLVQAVRYKPEGRGFVSLLCFGIFHWHNPSGRNMALGSTQPLSEMNIRHISLGGKGGRCVRLTTLPPSCVVMKSGNLKFLEPSGPLQACNRTSLPFYLTSTSPYSSWYV